MMKKNEWAGMMNTRQELLAAIAQLPDEKLPSLLNFAQALKDAETASGQQPMDIRSFLNLSPERQKELFAEQVSILAPYFQPGTEAMEWAEDY